MTIRNEIRELLDGYYAKIHINDFSSFIKSDFRGGELFDLSEERAQQNILESRQVLDSIQCWLDSGKLSREEEIILDICADFCRYIIRNAELYWFKFNLTHNTTPLPYVIKRLETYPLTDAAALDTYIMLLEQFPDKLSGMLEKLRAQNERGIRLPKEQQTICLNLLDSLIQSEDSLLHPWCRSDTDICIDDEKRQRISAAVKALNEALTAVREDIAAGYEDIEPGLCHIEGGLECYRQQIITYTSYALDPEELHSIGLRELEVTRNKMRAIIKELGFDMELPEFQQYLKDNRICFDNSVEELQQRFDDAQAKIEPRLPEYFIHMPKAGCRCEALPKSKEKSTSWGYYSVPIGVEKEGVFYYSAAELDSRSQIRTAAIVAHELLPGHHFQMNLISEDSSLPAICREHFNTAFADGWAEYSADLVGEMGVYGLYELYGRYVWDMVLCCRLVVDTGLNAMGWSMECARKFMKDNTILTDEEIFTETLRYAVDMPGQALAYKFGSLKMHELRRRAESALGEKFDIRAYHDEVLRYGSAPLNLLEKIVDFYIADNI